MSTPQERRGARTRRGIRLVIGIALREHPGLSTAVTAMALVLALLPAVQLWVLGTLVDGIAGGESTSLVLVVLLGLTLGLATVVNSIQVPFRERLYTDVSGTLVERELQIFVDADPGLLGDPDVQDQVRIRRESADSRSRQLLETLLNFLVGTVTSLGVGGVLLTISPLVALLMVCAAAAPLLVMGRITRTWQRAETEIAAPGRVQEDLFHLSVQSRAFATIIQHGGGRRVQSESMRMWRTVRAVLLGAQRREALLCLASALVTTLFVIAALLVLLRGDAVSVGDMAIVASSVAAFATLAQLMVWVSGIGQIAQFVGDLASPVVAPVPAHGASGRGPGTPSLSADAHVVGSAGVTAAGGLARRLAAITLRDASFTYRGRTEPAIEDLTARFAARGLVILTGPNGAGKSTLSTLLAGAHRLGSGQVRWEWADGTTSEPRWREVSVLHQDEAMLPLSVRDFVRMGVEAPDGEILDALTRTGLGALLEAMPDLLDRRLGEGYDAGTAFSGGQFQRLCLARLLLQDRPMWVLDEPTSAIDAAGDADFLALLREVGADRFIVVITHKDLGTRAGDELWRVEGGGARQVSA